MCQCVREPSRRFGQFLARRPRLCQHPDEGGSFLWVGGVAKAARAQLNVTNEDPWTQKVRVKDDEVVAKLEVAIEAGDGDVVVVIARRLLRLLLRQSS